MSDQTVTNAPTPGIPGTQNPQAQADAKAPAAEPALTPQERYELKVNGQVRRYTLDELKAKASISDAATEKFEQAARIAKESGGLSEALKKDFIQALQDPRLGLSKQQIRERFEGWYKENFIDPEVMTPEQRDAAQAKKERDELKKWKEESEQKKQKELQDSQDAQARDVLQNEIIQTLEKSNLPKTRFTASRIAFWMKQNLTRGFDAPMEVVVQQVKDERNQIAKSLFDESSPEQLVEMFGEDMIKKLRKFDLERIKQKLAPNAGAEIHTPKQRSGNQPKTMADVDKYFNDLRRTKR